MQTGYFSVGGIVRQEHHARAFLGGGRMDCIRSPQIEQCPSLGSRFESASLNRHTGQPGRSQQNSPVQVDKVLILESQRLDQAFKKREVHW